MKRGVYSSSAKVSIKHQNLGFRRRYLYTTLLKAHFSQSCKTIPYEALYFGKATPTKHETVPNPDRKIPVDGGVETSDVTRT